MASDAMPVRSPKRAEAVDDAVRQRRQVQHAEGIGGEFSEGLFGHGRNASRRKRIPASCQRRPL